MGLTTANRKNRKKATMSDTRRADLAPRLTTGSRKKPDRWMQNAVKNPGAFTAKAKRAGKSVAGYAKQVLKKNSKASPKTKKQAVLAKTFRKAAAKNKKQKTSR